MRPPTETDPESRLTDRRARVLVLVLGAYTALAGSVSFLGWPLDRPWWADWNRDGISIQPNAAIAAVFLGTALVLLASGRGRLAGSFALAPLAIGAATLTQHATGTDLGIDAPLRFGRSWGLEAVTFPGRMGPPASLSWTLLGTGAVLAAWGRGRARATASILGVVAASLATFSLVGYLFGAESLHTLPRATAIAMQTATMIFAGGTALVAAVGERGLMRHVVERGAAGLLIRRSLPFVLFVPIVVGLLTLSLQEAGAFDVITGRALLALAQVLLLIVLLAWCASSVRRHERSLTAALEAKSRGEELQRRQGAFLEKLVGASPLPIAVVEGEDLRYTLVNPAYAAVVGRGRPAVGRRLEDVYPEIAALGAGDRIRDVIRTGNPWKVGELETATLGGRRTWWQGEVTSLRDARAEPSALILIWDVTERVLSERALRDQERLLQNLTEHARVGLAILSPERRYLYANSAYAEILGRDGASLVGRSAIEVLGPSYAGIAPSLDRAFAGERVQLEHAISPHGAREEPRFLSVTYEPRLEGPTVDGVVVAVVDVSQRKQAEIVRERLLEREIAARAEVERAARLKDEFLATLSHELRTPLNAILGWSQLLKPAAAGHAELGVGLEVIERNARLQAQLIADLLDLSRVISGKLRLDLRTVRLEEIVDLAIETARPAADAKGVQVERAVEPGLQPIEADPARLQQIVWNLLSNAVKFSSRGGRIEVALARRCEQVEIRVSDGGEGIAPEFLPHLFERFRQADASYARMHGGLGIGLAIVKQLAELHGGSVRASSPGRGQGATFVVELPIPSPRGAGGSAVDEERGPRPRAGALDARLAGKHVLVVDDQADARALLARMLEDSGARVTTAGSCDQALELFARESFDLLISDISMPLRDGYDLIREVRRRGLAIPALALTAFAHAEDRARALSAGYQDHIAKPVEAGDLFAAVGSIV